MNEWGSISENKSFGIAEFNWKISFPGRLCQTADSEMSSLVRTQSDSNGLDP